MTYNLAKKYLKESKNLSKVKEFLNEASKAYYNTDKVIITDIQYDELYKMYVDITGDEFIGSEPNSKKGTINVSHDYKNLVGTLRKARNLSEIDEYLDKYFKVKLNQYNIRLSLKYDGNSVTIEYDENGNVIKALTRGRDGKGKDLTNVFKTFKKDSLFFENGEYAIKYEVIITYDNYNKICEEFEEEYANPRSLVSGILGSDDAYKYKDYLTLVPLEMRVKEDGESICFEDGLKKLYESEPVFHQDPNNLYSFYSSNIVVKNKKEAKEKITEYYNHVNEIRSELPFMIDGIVVDFLNEKIIENYFYDPKGFIPEHSFAVKLPYLEAIGVVNDIDFCVGNSGRITPRIWFTGIDGTPICFNGTEHTKQQISNYKRFKELNLGKGSKILVTYNNDCLSYITKLDVPENKKIKPFEYCDECPSCGGDVYIIENSKGEETLTQCENPNCPSRILGKIENYLVGIDVKGIKINTIEKLFEDKVFKDISSIYTFNKSEAAKSIGKKNAENMYNAIKENIPYDYEMIGSLTIDKIGRENAKVICKKYSLEELMNMSENNMKKNIRELDGFSDLKTKYFVEGFKQNKNILEFLMKNVNHKTYKNEFKNIGEGLKIVFTGFRNKGWEFELEKQGHKVTSSVSGKTNLVVYGDEPGATKMNKAKELNIETIYIDEFKERFNLS